MWTILPSPVNIVKMFVKSACKNQEKWILQSFSFLYVKGSVIRKMDAVSSCETSVNIYNITLRQSPVTSFVSPHFSTSPPPTNTEHACCSPEHGQYAFLLAMC
jgi:hypothetical protein